MHQLQPQRVRVESTTASGSWSVSDDGVFHLGDRKDHRPDVLQFKGMLSAWDPLVVSLVTQVIAEGYERCRELGSEVEGQSVTWTERRLIVRSLKLHARLGKAQAALTQLMVHKQGTRVPRWGLVAASGSGSPQGASGSRADPAPDR